MQILIAAVMGVGVGLDVEPRSTLALGLSATVFALIFIYAAMNTWFSPRVDMLRGIAVAWSLWFECAAMGIVLATQLIPPPDASLEDASLPTPPKTLLQQLRFAFQVRAGTWFE